MTVRFILQTYAIVTVDVEFLVTVDVHRSGIKSGVRVAIAESLSLGWRRVTKLLILLLFRALLDVVVIIVVCRRSRRR